MTEPAAYRLHHPHGDITHADGLASYGPGQTPPTWFLSGVAYIPADHPRAAYYLAGPYRAEPVDAIPVEYAVEAGRLTRQPEHRLEPPTADAAA